MEQAEASLLPVIKCFSLDQKGESFGERFTDAIEQAFELGYDELIVTGSDTPDISAAIFRQAATRLRSDQLVLGPSTDGGVYLIGIHKELFRRDLFLNIPWLSSKVCESLQEYAAVLNATIAYQETFHDVDSVCCIQRFAWSDSSWFHQLLAQLFASVKKARMLQGDVVLTTYSHTTAGLRGPPSIRSLHFA